MRRKRLEELFDTEIRLGKSYSCVDAVRMHVVLNGKTVISDE